MAQLHDLIRETILDMQFTQVCELIKEVRFRRRQVPLKKERKISAKVERVDFLISSLSEQQLQEFKELIGGSR